MKMGRRWRRANKTKYAGNDQSVDCDALFLLRGMKRFARVGGERAGEKPFRQNIVSVGGLAVMQDLDIFSGVDGAGAACLGEAVLGRAGLLWLSARRCWS